MKGLGIYNEDAPVLKSDLDLVEENISRILLTTPGERVNNPLFGCKLKNFIFDLDDLFKEDFYI